MSRVALIQVHSPLKTIISERNLTVQDFADVAGVSYATVDNVVRAIRPIGPKLLKFLERDGFDTRTIVKLHEDAMKERRDEAMRRWDTNAPLMPTAAE